MGDLSEFEIIRRFFAPLAKATPGAFGLVDDGAVLTVPPGQRPVVTTDTLVSGVHFPDDEHADVVGERALAVNVSDLAAMAATPLAYTLALALPNTWSSAVRERWLTAFVSGLGRGQHRFSIDLVGGDTVATPGPLTITVTALGSVETGRELRRSTARAGDIVHVTGTIGDAALGLLALRGAWPSLSADQRAALIARFRRPEPRLAIGRALAGVANAAADISDGLVADLGHISDASSLAAVVDSALLPLSPTARRVLAMEPGQWVTVLTGGDDYELVFTAPPGANSAVAQLAADLGVGITAIGRMERPGDGQPAGRVTVIGPDGAPMHLGRAGFRHF